MEEHNELTRRTCALALAVHRAGGEFIIENPVDRSDAELFCRMMARTDCSRSIAHMHHESHGALWRMPCVRELQAETDAAQLHLPQCAFGALRQKWTQTSSWNAMGLLEPATPKEGEVNEIGRDDD